MAWFIIFFFLMVLYFLVLFVWGCVYISLCWDNHPFDVVRRAVFYSSFMFISQWRYYLYTRLIDLDIFQRRILSSLFFFFPSSLYSYSINSNNFFLIVIRIIYITPILFFVSGPRVSSVSDTQSINLPKTNKKTPIQTV